GARTARHPRAAGWLAKVGSVAHFDHFPEPQDYAQVKTYSERTLTLSWDKMIEACGQIVDCLKAYDPNMWIESSVSCHESESLLVTSGGVCHHSTSTGWGLGASVQRIQGTDMLLTGYGRGWCDLNEFFDPDVVSQKVLENLRWAEKTCAPPRGRVPVFVPSERMGMWLWPVLMGVNGRSVAKGESPLASRLGQQILACNLTLRDDPHRDYAHGACEIDPDGIPTRKHTIVEKGVLKMFLYDLDTAGLAGTSPTGSPGCGTCRPCLDPGKDSQIKLLSQVEDGLYVCDLIGFGQSNIINGDFSCNVGLGYRIKNGEIVGRVKNTMLAGNIYDLLSGGVRLSRETDYTGAWPCGVIEGMACSSSETN
ncbi:MAG TPA: metallopeptidase TldD-related protein, partial [bacterium]|nr:metallopeptidase TldD-related protein [bacterium]